MCEFISFFHNPVTGDIKVKDLNSHGNTEKELSLDHKYWREGHYLPNGKIVARVEPNDKKTEAECTTRIGQAYPRFVDFLSWVLKETNQLDVFNGNLYLAGLTSAKDLVLPKTVGGGLSLDGLTSAKDLVLPKTVGGSLYLNKLTSEERNAVMSKLQ